MTIKQLQGMIRDRRLLLLACFIAAMVVFNIAFIASSGWARLGWNTLAYFGLFLTFRLAGLTRASIGLSKSTVPAGLRYATYVIVPIGLILVIVFLVDKAAFQDPRYHQSLPAALYAALVLLPLKTVLFEELAFRGILPALLLGVRDNRRLATILSSLAFGLWHILSATKISDFHPIADITIPAALVIIGVFIFTSAAGYVLCELRWRSDSLAAPIAVHWFVNGIGTILSAVSWV